MLTAATLRKFIDEELNSREHTSDYDPSTVRATLDTLRKVLAHVEFDPNIDIADLLSNFLAQFERSEEGVNESALKLAYFFGERKGEQGHRKRKKAVRK